jgi:hypothetical protein
MRKLGDDYVRNEFKLHKTATDPAQLKDFFTAWEGYLKMMSQSKDKFGRDLNPEQKSTFSEEQKIKLDQLRDEVKFNR